MRAQLHAIIFDLGDTLVDLREGSGDYEARVRVRAGWVYDALAAAGVALEERDAFCAALAHDTETRYQAAVARQEGIDIYDVMAAFCAERGIPADDGLVQIGGNAYCRGTGAHASLRAGAIELLTELHARGLRLGVISNTIQPAHFMDEALRRRGIAHFFAATVYSSAVRVAKPHPAIFRAGLAALGVPAEVAVYVGDRPEADVAGAHGVGMKAVLIEVAHRNYPGGDFAPDARIAALPELLEVLPRLFS
ncbi:MAG: HAD family hydrolase [Chloroflexi bacterium]|nr:HAD family hydrolase [Chloroflexota bacterium]